jgi:hypothetical protein
VFTGEKFGEVSARLEHTLWKYLSWLSQESRVPKSSAWTVWIKLQCVNVNLFVEVPGINVEQHRTFSPSCIIRIRYFIFNVFRLFNCWFHYQSKSPWADMMGRSSDFCTGEVQWLVGHLKIISLYMTIWNACIHIHEITLITYRFWNMSMWLVSWVFLTAEHPWKVIRVQDQLDSMWTFLYILSHLIWWLKCEYEYHILSMAQHPH